MLNRRLTWPVTGKTRTNWNDFFKASPSLWHGVAKGIDVLRFWSATLRRFMTACGGNVAMIYGLALVPLTLATGGGLDYARAVVVEAAMNDALDSAALAVASAKGLSQTQMQTLAQQYFDANYHQSSDYGRPVAVTVTKSGQTVTVSTSCDMPTTMLRVAGYANWTVKASSTVTYGQTKLWVALVLDNTGSMSDSDRTGLTKMSALKSASHSLLTLLQGAGTNPGDVRVSIIPFARNVKIGTSYATSDWLSFDDFAAAPPKPASSIGPGSKCPWSDNDEGYHCIKNSTNGSNDISKIADNGNICPSDTLSGHYWNGCYDSVSTGWNSWSHTWHANDNRTWSGCVTDRGLATKPTGSDYDVNVATPSPQIKKSMMVAENSPSCPVASVLGLSYDWTALSNKIDAMSPSGATNQTIGLVWGWHSLTQGAPLNPPALPDQTQRVLIILSDGLNTQNRWSGNGSSQSSDVDSRMALVCANAKAAGLVVYAVYVDINGAQGNSSVLQSCASDASKYYDLTSAGQIQQAFTDIGQQITNLRVSQ
jgi:Flp pilus assembly protein TadG